MRRLCVLVIAASAALAGCAAPYDDDGEAAPAGRLAPVAASADGPATPVVVDTDLGGDDLVALAFLLRHPGVQVEAVTIAATGLVGCDPGLAVVAGLFAALEAPPVPVACGRHSPGPGARQFPEAWRRTAEKGTGITPVSGTLVAAPVAAPELIAERAASVDGLVVVALGPLTNLADLAKASPQEYSRLAGVHAMVGSVGGPAVDGVAEWNAAADPSALAAVLAAPAPLTVVPEDAVPDGTPEALKAPVVGRVAAVVDYPKWWDLATAAALVAPQAGDAEPGRWALDDALPGRLRSSGAGAVRVHRSLDTRVLQAEYARAFSAE